jgi:hypothetical protein
MPRKKSDIHYIYKTTCLVTNRYYIGMHSTCNLNDGYLGSGKRLRYSIRKYGIEYHKKEILEFFENRKLLIEAEKKYVTADLIHDSLCMNLKNGGTGGISNKKHYVNFINAGIDNFKRTKTAREGKFKTLFKDSEWLKKRNVNISLALKGKENGWKGKHHSQITINKFKINRKGSGAGIKNSQYGTCWIMNGIDNKKIKKEENIPLGWNFGRTL